MTTPETNRLRRSEGPHDFAGRSGARQMSLMHVFRSAVQKKDARAPVASYRQGERDVTIRSQKHREGASDFALRQDLARDIVSLMNTIRLDALTDLEDFPYVARSVINFGFQDLAGVWRANMTMSELGLAIHQTLLRNEPRLRASTLEVRLRDEGERPDQRVTFEILAEMIASPSDIAMKFLAEVEPSLGKIQMKRMRGGS